MTSLGEEFRALAIGFGESDLGCIVTMHTCVNVDHESNAANGRKSRTTELSDVTKYLRLRKESASKSNAMVYSRGDQLADQYQSILL